MVYSVERRSVLRAAAWSVPTVMITAQAPAMAASGIVPVVECYSDETLTSLVQMSTTNLALKLATAENDYGSNRVNLSALDSDSRVLEYTFDSEDFWEEDDPADKSFYIDLRVSQQGLRVAVLDRYKPYTLEGSKRVLHLDKSASSGGESPGPFEAKYSGQPQGVSGIYTAAQILGFDDEFDGVFQVQVPEVIQSAMNFLPKEDSRSASPDSLRSHREAIMSGRQARPYATVVPGVPLVISIPFSFVYHEVSDNAGSMPASPCRYYVNYILEKLIGDEYVWNRTIDCWVSASLPDFA